MDAQSPIWSQGLSTLIKRSFSLAGHRTSVALEQEFWTALLHIARACEQNLSALVAATDASRAPDRPLASALRVMALPGVCGGDRGGGQGLVPCVVQFDGFISHCALGSPFANAGPYCVDVNDPGHWTRSLCCGPASRHLAVNRMSGRGFICTEFASSPAGLRRHGRKCRISSVLGERPLLFSW